MPIKKTAIEINISIENLLLKKIKSKKIEDRLPIKKKQKRINGRYHIEKESKIKYSAIIAYKIIMDR
jgi:hypothetical protein